MPIFRGSRREVGQFGSGDVAGDKRSRSWRQAVMIALLIRHALISARDTLGQRAPVSLSDEGEAQARRLADRMRGRELAAVITSPLARAVETARVVAEAKQVPLIMDHALREVDV